MVLAAQEHELALDLAEDLRRGGGDALADADRTVGEHVPPQLVVEADEHPSEDDLRSEADDAEDLDDVDDPDDDARRDVGKDVGVKPEREGETGDRERLPERPANEAHREEVGRGAEHARRRAGRRRGRRRHAHEAERGVAPAHRFSNASRTARSSAATSRNALARSEAAGAVTAG